jgi:hypothetical protein
MDVQTMQLLASVLSAEVESLQLCKQEGHQACVGAVSDATGHAADLTALQLRMHQLSIASDGNVPAMHKYPIIPRPQSRFNPAQLHEVLTRLASQETHRYSAPSWPGADADLQAPVREATHWHAIGTIVLVMVVRQGRAWRECGVVLKSKHSAASGRKIYFPESHTDTGGDSEEVAKDAGAHKIVVAQCGHPGHWVCLQWVWYNLQDLPRDHPSSMARWINLTAKSSIEHKILADESHSELKADVQHSFDADEHGCPLESLQGRLHEHIPPHCLCAGDTIEVTFHTGRAHREAGTYKGIIIGQIGDCWSWQFSIVCFEGPQGPNSKRLWEPEEVDLSPDEGYWALLQMAPGKLMISLCGGVEGFAYSLAKGGQLVLLQAFEINPTCIHAAYARFDCTSVSYTSRGNMHALNDEWVRDMIQFRGACVAMFASPYCQGLSQQGVLLCHSLHCHSLHCGVRAQPVRMFQHRP